MSRQILPGVHWIQECGPSRMDIGRGSVERDHPWYEPWWVEGRDVHVPQNAYLFLGERSALFDTLSPASREHVIAEAEELLGGRELDFLVVSHPDVPHAGNTGAILRRWPACELVAPARGDTHALYHLDRARKVWPGDELDLGGPLLRFHDPTFMDAPIHVWMTEVKSQALFSVDWMGFPHMEGECLRFADELEAPVGVSRLYEFHGRVLFWFQYVDVDRTRAVTRWLWRDFEPELLAPAHGLVIREGVETWFREMEEVVARVRETGRIGVL